MTKSIPLSPTLRIQSISINICYILRDRFDTMLECLAAESRCLGDVHRKTRRIH